MSLRVVHIFFIIAASLLALGGGMWVLQQHQSMVWAAVWMAASLALDVYLVWFIKTSKGLSAR